MSDTEVSKHTSLHFSKENEIAPGFVVKQSLSLSLYSWLTFEGLALLGDTVSTCGLWWIILTRENHPANIDKTFFNMVLAISYKYLKMSVPFQTSTFVRTYDAFSILLEKLT